MRRGVRNGTPGMEDRTRTQPRAAGGQNTDCPAQRVSASIVVYGGADKVRHLLDSATEFGPGGVKLYLIDNHSPDGAMDTLEAGGLPQGTTALWLPKNRGYGSGHNAALPLLGSQYHAVLNPDLVFDGPILQKMADWMDAHPDVVITTPRLKNPDGTPQYIAKRRPSLLPLLSRQMGFKNLKKYEAHYLMLDEDLDKEQDVEFCSGSFFMIRTDVFREIGGFDEGYFMYVEDADITMKALKKGRAVYLPWVSVIHEWQRESHANFRKFLWQTKSMLRYFRKWGFKFK